MISGEAFKAYRTGVNSGKTFQTSHADFFPQLRKNETVFYPVKAWNIGNANSLEGPKDEATTCAGMCCTFFPEPYVIQDSSTGVCWQLKGREQSHLCRWFWSWCANDLLMTHQECRSSGECRLLCGCTAQGCSFQICCWKLAHCYRESSKPFCLQEVPMKRPEIGYVIDNFINGFTNVF